MSIKEILNGDDKEAKKALFVFDANDSDQAVLWKFKLWSINFFPKYFSSPDAPWHKEIDRMNLLTYKGKMPKRPSFMDIAFRGGAKTARTKLFLAFCICNDRIHFRKYIKVFSEDGNNSKQIVTDIYNMLVHPPVKDLYPEVFAKTTTKREETMGSFTTSTLVKMVADTVGADGGRGALQEEARPDLLWFEDFENRKTLRSNRLTKTIWDNMEEARTGLAKGGHSIYTCNYISEQGNVHRLVMMHTLGINMLIIPIEDDAGNSTWVRYSKADIDQMRQTDDDFEGERLCKPSASKDVYFDREMLDKQVPGKVKRDSAGFKIFYEFNPSHRYAAGHDVAGGVGLDSSTSVFYDFDQIPARVVATFRSNTIKPEVFGDEIYREANFFGGCLVAPEDNYGSAVIMRLKQLEANMYIREQNPNKVMPATQTAASKQYGFNTNGNTKNVILSAFAKAIEEGSVELTDADLILEAKAYTRNDLIETEPDPRLTTRHFDMLMAAAIGWHMRNFATVMEEVVEDDYNEAEEYAYPHIGL